ncbi:hypothetical protein H6G14_06115 [Nostoc parmelioides FACHB-3921]|uniref:Uncharacterized protein n=1 Tax=Nostoc parmelioides FACHB-3921 TaxID=2692909 RepID=A0ABR8BAY7_9NOSO|nr:hypothetical protein [Nostoc parmelioides FACHB-3921]
MRDLVCVRRTEVYKQARSSVKHQHQDLSIGLDRIVYVGDRFKQLPQEVAFAEYS